MTKKVSKTKGNFKKKPKKAMDMDGCVSLWVQKCQQDMLYNVSDAQRALERKTDKKSVKMALKKRKKSGGEEGQVQVRGGQCFQGFKNVSGACICMVYDVVDEYMVPGTMGALKKAKKSGWEGGKGRWEMKGSQ